MTWDDPRFEEYGMNHLLEVDWPENNIDVNIWNPSLGRKNIELAEKANVSITFSDQTLAESGTAVLFSDKGKGRAVSLLPTTYIAIIPKSTIVLVLRKRLTAFTGALRMANRFPHASNFISGPSNSADIEMNLVVGVHGPVKATYIVVQDR
ncbi:LutC/YkgG family protein [Bacillus fonticola]|uniref:LutC/YkgG family protein n=1 Tax=Bacillus fonticola TaxID=2728853 RepID=UPI001474A524|nr:lactate utilization protein C [Bacillus fonticola]